MSESALNGALTNKWVFSQTIAEPTSNVQSVTNSKIGTANSIAIGLKWNVYKGSALLLKQGSYHVIFDNNGSMYTAVVTWDGNTITISNKSDVYIDTVSGIIPII